MEKPKLYLDEDITDLLARVLRTMGYDVVSAHEIKMKSRAKEMLKRAVNLLDSNSSDDLKDRYIWL